jgi:hypothetical protein
MILRTTFIRAPNCLSYEQLLTYLGTQRCGPVGARVLLQTGCSISTNEDFDRRRL